MYNIAIIKYLTDKFNKLIIDEFFLNIDNQKETEISQVNYNRILTKAVWGMTQIISIVEKI